MRVESKGNRATVFFDKAGEREQHMQELVRWCNSNGLHPSPAAARVNVGFSSLDDAPRELEELELWCRQRVSAETKRKASVMLASEFKRDEPAKPIFETEQRTPFEMWNLWYKILHEKFPAVVQPKKAFKRELGMLRIMLDAYDHLIVEKIFSTAVHGWETLLSRHRGLSEVPILELVMKFRSELQVSASGGVFKQTGKKAERTTEHDEQINAAAERASAELAEKQRAKKSAQ